MDTLSAVKEAAALSDTECEIIKLAYYTRNVPNDVVRAAHLWVRSRDLDHGPQACYIIPPSEGRPNWQIMASAAGQITLAARAGLVRMDEQEFGPDITLPGKLQITVPEWVATTCHVRSSEGNIDVIKHVMWTKEHVGGIMWSKMPRHMASLRARALAIRACVINAPAELTAAEITDGYESDGKLITGESPRKQPQQKQAKQETQVPDDIDDLIDGISDSLKE